MTAELKYTVTGDDGTSIVTLKGEYTKFDNFGYISNPTYFLQTARRDLYGMERGGF